MPSTIYTSYTYHKPLDSTVQLPQFRNEHWLKELVQLTFARGTRIESQEQHQDVGCLSPIPYYPTDSKSKLPSFFIRRSTSPLIPTRSPMLAIGDTMPFSSANNDIKSHPMLGFEGQVSGTAISESQHILKEDLNSQSSRRSMIATDSSDVLPPENLLDDQQNASRDAKYVPTLNMTSTLLSPTAPTSSTSTPHTTITPPTPTDHAVRLFPVKSLSSSAVNGTKGSDYQGNRVISRNTPSKLSQHVTGPAPPSSEFGIPKNVMSSALQNAAPATGFFSSMFSVAQNAATSVTNATLNLGSNNVGNRSRNIPHLVEKTEKLEKEGKEDVVVDDATLSTALDLEERNDMEKEAAVKTLGMGELSLGSLGIETNLGEEAHFEIDSNMAGADSSHHANDDQVQSIMNEYDTTAESGFTSLGPRGGQHRTLLVEGNSFLGSSVSGRGDATPDGSSTICLEEDSCDVAVRRTASVKSGETPAGRRHRGSSAASSGNALHSVPKPTGFAVASKKRNRDFHNLFRSVPEDDYLIEDYGCALQKEILLQGRMYVSEGHITFYSNIFGWVTQLVISFDEVMSVEKKSTAMLFPNAIVVQTLHARHVFASFISRDSTYDLIVGIWKVGHPQLVQTPSESHVHENDGLGSGESGDEDEYEDSEDGLGESFTDAGDIAIENERKDEPINMQVRKPPQALSTAERNEKIVALTGDEFPGPLTHAPTSCGEEDQHFDKPLCDDVIPAPLGRVYSLLFGPASFAFVSSFLSETEKVLELSIPNNGDWVETEGKKARGYSYIKPLSGGIGPKQTRCNITETIECCDLDDHVTVVATIQTPDVPSGNVFVIKTRYCLMWAENNETRIVCNCTIEWSGKSWIKGRQTCAESYYISIAEILFYRTYRKRLK